MKTVCIVGAGPGGLVAAKVFLQTGKFKVIVFEKNDRIGGIWALDRNSRGGFLAPTTPTNLSRFTVGFSDLDWNSVDLHDDERKTTKQQNGSAQQATPIFPKAWMANKYLEAYQRKYIPNGVIQCSSEVKEAKRHDDKWIVTVQRASSDVQTLEFDYLIMASGFFAQPRSTSQSLPFAPSSDRSHNTVQFVHTSALRTLTDLFPGDKPIRGKNILVIGGGNSSGEAAAAIAFQLSNARWSPDRSTRHRYQDVQIVQVLARPLYPVPPFVEYDEGSRSYVPIDFKLYDFSRRPEGMPSYGGRQTMEVRNTVHGFLQTMLGGDLADVDPALVSVKGPERGCVYVALSEGYSEYVRSGDIKLILGRVEQVQNIDDGVANATVKHEGDVSTIDDIGAVVFATGYTPIPGLDILDTSTKEAVQYDPESLRLPMILEQWQTMRKEAPAVSFLGFYEGPYWGIMELQAKLTAKRWLSGDIAPVQPHEVAESLVQLRQSMYAKDRDVPEYWFGDHLGNIVDLAAQLDLKRNDGKFAPREGVPSPARYVDSNTNVQEASSIMSELQQLWEACTVDGKFVSRAAFRGLQGSWTIRRTIDSASPTFPSGMLEGTASFHPRTPTPDASGLHFDFEYLYIESGTFTLSTGATMTAKRRYVYRYSEARDALSVWFVKPDNDLVVDYLFHDLAFVKPEAARKAGGLVATADHPCGNDMYWTEYKMPLKGVALRSFQIKHTVKGPKKEYVSVTYYDRPKRT